MEYTFSKAYDTWFQLYVGHISSSLPTCVCCHVCRGVKGQLFEKKCSRNSFGLKTSPKEEV